MPVLYTYDKKSQKSILEYTKRLINKTLRNFVDESIILENKSNSNRKGQYGNLIEEYYFGYKTNSISEPDFKEAGLELKTSPLKQLIRGGKVPKERLVMNMINFLDIVNESRENSSFLKKNQNLLLIMYLYEQEKELWDYIIEFVEIWNFPGKDLALIKQDWLKIQEKIKNGKAHELSEGDTLYLGACTKSSTSKNRRKQPFSDITAKPRAFSLKPGYIKTIIAHFANKEKTESIIKDDSTTGEDFETYVKNKFKNYIGLSPEGIAKKLGVKLNINSKQYLAKLARQILGVQGNKIEEFEKSDITMKVLRLKTNGKPKEAISFPAFKYKEIIEEEREESETLQMMDKKFFFVIFQYDKEDNLYFKKTMFWNIPYNDLHKEVKWVFDETQKRILNGNIDNLPKITENRVSHIRPHGRNRADTYEAPDGRNYTKKSFWFNMKYIAEQIK